MPHAADAPPTPGLRLPTVTLCAVTSVNVAATVAALEATLSHADFAEALLFCDRDPGPRDPRITWVPIDRLTSPQDYSHFLLKRLAPRIRTEHVMVVQWDGFLTDPARWDDAFLGVDYIGAPWPQFGDGHDVGNGGFSLRSKRLVDLLASDGFAPHHPEDVAIGRIHRAALERDHGIRFAPAALAHRFSVERSGRVGDALGFHGIYNLIPSVGAERFWDVYQSLDSKGPLFHDLMLILWQLGRGRDALKRRWRMIADYRAARRARLREPAKPAT